MKKEAFQNEEDMKDELGDAGFFRLRDLQDQLSYAYQELAELKAKESQIGKFINSQNAKLDIYKAVKHEDNQRDSEIRQAIKNEKNLYRDLTKIKRDENKKDVKVFTKFVDANGLNNQLRSEAKSPKKSKNSSKLLTPNNEPTMEFSPMQE